MAEKTERENRKQVIRFILGLLRPAWRPILLLLFLIGVGAVLNNMTPFLYGQMLDRIGSGELSFLTSLILGYFFLTVGANVFSLWEGRQGKLLSFRMARAIQRRMFDAILRMKLSQSSQYETGELMSRLNGDADEVVSFSLNFVTGIFNTVITLVVSLIFVLRISLLLSTSAIFYIPCTFCLTFFARKHYKKLAELRKTFRDEFMIFQNESFDHIIGIKSFQAEGRTNEKYGGLIQRELDLTKRSIRLENIVGFSGSMITLVAALYVIYLSAVLISQGLLTIGLMVSFNYYSNRLFGAISSIWGLNIGVQSISVSIERIQSILEAECEDDARNSTALLSPEITHRVQVTGLRYAYSDDLPVLNGVNLRVDCPGLYGIVGRNGCGKSTLAKLLIKLYDPDEGIISLGHENYPNLSVESIRRRITFVQKEDYFMAASIAENLRLGNQSAGDEELRDVCDRVGIASFIETLENGYQTEIGGGGSTLSSGQRQKLSVARALLRESEVYVFDEVTANLDGQSERKVMETLQDLARRSVVFFISHRVASLDYCDMVYLMDSGKVIDEGTHLELLGRNPLYRELFAGG
ncbi:MAG: ABC transporter ATP-binding protein [Bacillota bacterium]|nr:ABC transporter ATP-binding protein [Bacillota bacterium]